MQYIDSHVHIWQLERGDYTWLKPENDVLYRNYTIADIGQQFPQQVTGIVLVQAAQTLSETQYMLACAEKEARIVAVVGGLDPVAADFMEQYAQVKHHPYLKGMRFNGGLFQQGAASANIHRALTSLQMAGHVLDVLVRPDDLNALLPYLDAHPDLTVVINHLGIPPYQEPDKREVWELGMSRLAGLPQVNCKISGMITQAKGRSPEEVAGWVQRLHAWFGPTRLLYGSDWPVALQGGDYTAVLALFEQSLPAEWDDADKAAVRAGNAARLYRIR